MSGQRGRLSVKTQRGIELISIDDIRLFKAEQKYVVIKTEHEEHLLDMTLKELERKFSSNFIRVHRSALVALKYITALEQMAQGQWFVKLNGLDEAVQVSRRHVPKVRKWLRDDDL